MELTEFLCCLAVATPEERRFELLPETVPVKPPPNYPHPWEQEEGQWHWLAEGGDLCARFTCAGSRGSWVATVSGRTILEMWRLGGEREPNPLSRLMERFNAPNVDAETRLDHLLLPVVRKQEFSLLNLYGRKGLVKSRAQGAALEARLVVFVMLSVPPEHRGGRSVRVEIPIRRLRGWIFPNRWNGRVDWGRLKTALEDCGTYYVKLANGTQWRPVLLRSSPPEDDAGNVDLDGRVALEVAYPPGADTGPPVDLNELAKLGVTSGPQWRAYLAAWSLAWQPGRTRRPVPGAPGRWGWSKRVEDYHVLTRGDRRRLAFGEDDTKNRTRAEIDAAWTDLPGLAAVTGQRDPRTGKSGWRIVPEDVAAQGHSRGI